MKLNESKNELNINNMNDDMIFVVEFRACVVVGRSPTKK